MNKRSTSNKCNHNKATVKKKPYRYSIADRVLQRCIKLNHITPFDCVTDEAPHRQIPYERRPFRGVRVFQISQDSLDYFLVAIRMSTAVNKELRSGFHQIFQREKRLPEVQIKAKIKEIVQEYHECSR